MPQTSEYLLEMTWVRGMHFEPALRNTGLRNQVQFYENVIPMEHYYLKLVLAIELTFCH